jgi:hypothetical protein
MTAVLIVLITRCLPFCCLAFVLTVLELFAAGGPLWGTDLMSTGHVLSR